MHAAYYKSLKEKLVWNKIWEKWKGWNFIKG